MQTIKRFFSRAYEALDARAMGKLTPAEREEVLALESWARKNWRQLLLGLSALVGAITLCIFLMGSGRSLIDLAGIALLLVLGGAISLTATWFGGAKRLEKRRLTSGKAIITLVLLAVVGGLVGLFIGGYMGGGWNAAVEKFQRLAGVAVGATLLLAMYEGGVIFLISHLRHQQAERANAALQAQANAEKLARQLTESRLKLLQAQVEPHFLFNTLASVQELAEERAPEAAALIAQLIVFLRGGLSGLRNEHTTLARDFEMVGAYLTIMKIRMGNRLQFSLALPAALAALSVPPAMLISLVENAIKHGLEPALNGGSISVSAFIEGEQVAIRVADTGLGAKTPPHALSSNVQPKNLPLSGVGLSNIRERLLVLYGNAACLSATSNDDGIGFVATLQLPIRTTV